MPHNIAVGIANVQQTFGADPLYFARRRGARREPNDRRDRNSRTTSGGPDGPGLNNEVSPGEAWRRGGFARGRRGTRAV